MRAIIDVHFPGLRRDLLKNALELFFSIRDLPGLKKKPSTSELLDWLKLLVAEQITPEMLHTSDQQLFVPPLHGSHSIWPEACFDLGTQAVLPAGSHAAAQRPGMSYTATDDGVPNVASLHEAFAQGSTRVRAGVVQGEEPVRRTDQSQVPSAAVNGARRLWGEILRLGHRHPHRSSIP